MKSQSKFLLALLLIFALGTAAYFIWQAKAQKNTLPMMSYQLLDGRQLASTQWQGKVMLVNFWATSCTTCVKEMPELVATYEKFKSRDFDLLAVAMSYDNPEYVANFVKTRQLPFGVAIDQNGTMARSFGEVTLTPTTFLLDAEGRVIKTYIGAPDFKALHQLIEKLLPARS
jgi:peroxiredoxin